MDPLPEPQKTQTFILRYDTISKFVVMPVLAYTLIGKNPRGDDSKNKQCDNNVKRPPVSIHNTFVRGGKNRLSQSIFIERIKKCF